MSVQARTVTAALEQALRSLAEAAATIREVQRQVADLPFEESTLPACPLCGPVALPRGTSLGEHIENVHGGSVSAAVRETC